MKNAKLLNFKKITLQNKPNQNITLKGSIILNLVEDVTTQEVTGLYKDIKRIMDREVFKSDQKEFSHIWGGEPMDKIIFEKIKKDILIQITAELDNYAKTNDILKKR
jgi:hypothetical protein